MENDKLKQEKQCAIHNVMPSIGYRYYIIENGKKIWGMVDSYEGTGFYVKWDDGTITHEEKCDNAR